MPPAPLRGAAIRSSYKFGPPKIKLLPTPMLNGCLSAQQRQSRTLFEASAAEIKGQTLVHRTFSFRPVDFSTWAFHSRNRSKNLVFALQDIHPYVVSLVVSVCHKVFCSTHGLCIHLSTYIAMNQTKWLLRQLATTSWELTASLRTWLTKCSQTHQPTDPWPISAGFILPDARNACPPLSLDFGSQLYTLICWQSAQV